MLVFAASVLVFAGAPAAFAASRTVTVTGGGEDGFTPDSVTTSVSVDAMLSHGIASGHLTTVGERGGLPPQNDRFDGNVTCMVIHGKQVTVGAFGTARVNHENGRPPTPLPGTYAQVLTVEFGRFTSPDLESSPTYSDSFGVLGAHHIGLLSKTPPNCAAMGSFTHQLLPTFGGVIHMHVGS